MMKMMMSCGLLPGTPIRVVSFPRRRLELRSSDRRTLRTCSGNFRTCSYYELLGVSEGVTLDGIKKAYKQLARKYHPDVSPPNMAEEHTSRFIEVREAYEILSDPRRRAAYDVGLTSTGLHCANEQMLWKRLWRCQVSELESRSTSKEDSAESVTWGDHMRRKNA